MRVHAIEAAGNDSDEALAKALRKHGLRDKAHFDAVRDQFQSRFGHDPAFAQAALDARMRATEMQMNARMQGELKGELAPVDGISLEQWAWLMAKIASGGNLAELLDKLPNKSAFIRKAIAAKPVRVAQVEPTKKKGKK